jgi:hypothetical protein
MQMAKDAQAEMITIGLKDEGGMVDEASGNEVPNGALKEEVRDDQPAMLSPGEFVIPAYAVRYFGVERFVKMLRAAKQGMEQLDDMGLTGEPNADDASLETATLPTEVDEDVSQFNVGGAVTTTPLTNQPTQMSAQQFGVAPSAAIQPAAQSATVQPLNFAAPSPLTQQMYRPTAPIRPPGQQNVTYPQYVYSPEGGGGYGVAEYVGPNGQAIFVTTIGGKPVSQIPEGFKTRAQYNKDLETQKQVPTTTSSELQFKPEDMDPGSFEASEGEESLPGEDVPTTSEEYTTALQELGERAFGGKTVTLGSLATAFTGGAGALFSLLGIVGNKVSAAQAKGAIAKAMEQQGFKPKNPEKIDEDDLNKFISRQQSLASEGTQGKAVGTGTDITVDTSGQTVDGFGPGGTGGTGSQVTSMTPAEVAAAAVAGGQNINVAGQGGDSGAGEAAAEAAAADEAAAVDEAGQYGISFNAAGGLIKVGDKTYGPEDFGFANKGAFVTKKKTRKRKTKKGKGLASSK